MTKICMKEASTEQVRSTCHRRGPRAGGGHDRASRGPSWMRLGMHGLAQRMHGSAASSMRQRWCTPIHGGSMVHVRSHGLQEHLPGASHSPSWTGLILEAFPIGGCMIRWLPRHCRFDLIVGCLINVIRGVQHMMRHD